MDQTERLLHLLALLQARPFWTCADLAERLDVTPRTVRRDVAKLRDLGYRVEATWGRHGGYELSSGQALPPLVLTDEEAVALTVGLRSAAAAGVAGLDEAALTTITKLERGLPARLRDRIAAVDAATVPLARDSGGSVDPDILVAAAHACRRGERIRLAYRDRHGRETKRDVDPYRLVQAGRRWYLVARDIRRSAWRTFRVDRVGVVTPLAVPVRIDDPPDAAAMVSDSVALGPYQGRATVRLEVPADVAARLVPPTTAVLEADGDATLLRLGTDDYDWLARYIVGLARPFEILEPPELAAAVRALGRELADVPDPQPAVLP